MSVRFVIGRAGTGKTHFLRERLVEHVRPDPLNAKVIYLVPRQTTFSTQRAIATDERLNGYTGIRITSLDELAETALVETGRPAGARLDATGRSLLIGHLLRQHAGDLEHFGRSFGRPGLADEIDRTFGEFERAGQVPEEIAQFAENAGDGDSSRQQLGRKLRDLSRLYSNYQQFLIAHNLDPFQRQLSAPDAIASWPGAQGALVLIDEFYDYTVYERQVIAALAAVAGQTFISAMFDAASPMASNANLNPDELGLFLRTEEAYRRLHFAIASTKVPIDPPLLLSGGRRWKSPALAAVSHALDRNPPAPVEAKEAVRLCFAANAHDELEVAAREIKRLLFQNYRLRDICVLARSADAYSAHIEAAFTEHQIPYFVDRRRPAAHHPLVRTLQAIATIVQTRWSHDGVFDLLKAGLTGVASHDTDLLVDYVTQHRLTASAWAREEPWHYNRLDEDENRRLFSQPDVDIVNGVAARIRHAIGPLASPQDADTPKPISQHVTDLINALERLDIRRAMQRRIEGLDKANQTERREEEEQVWANWTDLCDRFHELLGEVELDASEFYRLLQTALDGLDLAVVPPTLDQVLVGSVDRTRVGEPKAVILIGLNECDFPLCQQERPILNDTDRVRLLEVGLEVDPPTRTALLGEQFLGYVALTRASEKLILIRTECDDHGQDCSPSVFWERATQVLARSKPEPRKTGLERITTATQAVSHLLSWASHQHHTIEPSDDAALYQWMVSTTDGEVATLRDLTWPSLRHRNAARLSQETAAKLFPSPLEGSVSRFESFAACPFQHFARYGLRLQRPTAAEFTAMDLGNLYHAVLDNLVAGTIRQKKDFPTAEGLTPDEIRGVSRQLAESIGDQLFLSDARSRFTLDQLDRTVHKLLKAQQFTAGVGQLRPAHTELTFGPGESRLPPVELNTPAGHTVRLRGKIDRIDTDAERNAYSVIDYKLAGESLDYGYVARGLMLQLLTYLLVLREHSGKLFDKQLTPAAALYVRVLRGIAGVNHPDEAPEPQTREFLLKQKPRGVISSDWANVIDPTIAPGVPSEVINYKLKKDGEPYVSGHEGVEAVTLEMLIEYVRRQVAELADQIIAGEIGVAPYLIARDTPCQSCDLQRVCRIDRSMNRYRVLDPLDQKQALAIIADPQAKAASMSSQLTAEQKRAIETYDRNLLVSAAAGSGKTHVLAERCAFLVCDAKPPCNADELLVVTFTVAAAEEMRRRIGAALSRRAMDSKDPRLLRQPLLLAGAQIGTIHSLCSSILRRHFHAVGLDPNFRLLDDDEAKLLRRDVANDLVERKLEGPDADITVRLLEHYAGGSPSRIVGTVLGLQSRLSSLCDPDKWLSERRDRLIEAASKPLRESELGRKAIGILQQRLETLTLQADRLILSLREAGVPKYEAFVIELRSLLADWTDALQRRPFDQVADIIGSTTLPRLPTIKDAEVRDRFKDRIEAVRKPLATFGKAGLFLFTEAALQADLQKTIWAVDALDDLVTSFEKAYAKAKQNNNALDFADLERFALDLLRDKATGQPTAIAEEYRRQFRHVLIDEYQDVNELQDTLLAMIAREEEGNLFCVGDVKQSIYRFRQADPARFIARDKRYSQGNTAVGEVINMRKNFRSRGPLLETLNGIFEALMTEASAEVEYDVTQRLVPGATFPEAPGILTGRPIELHVIEKKPTGQSSEFDADEREAVLVAERIRRLIGADGGKPVQVTDRGGQPRDANPGDFAVLLRTVRVKSERYASVLRRAGLPVLADSTTGFFNSTEVRDLLCALRLIDNSRHEYDLAGFLRSPLCNWPNAEDRLAAIRIAYPTKTTPWFHRAASRYAAEKQDTLAADLNSVFHRFDQWRDFAAERPVADIVWHVLQETNYLTWCAGLPDGEQRVANLLDLHERARAFDQFRRPTLSRFLHFLSNLEEEADLGMPSLAAKEQKAVRILSVHKSKGLEFPIVLLPDLGKAFNLREAGDTLLVDECVGLGLRVVDVEREAHYPSLASTVAQHEIRRRALAEELRVLYVASTRAREHLILIGTEEAGVEASWDAAGQGHVGAMPAGEVLAARSMFDWIGPAAAQVESAHPGLFVRHLHAADEMEALAKDLLEGGRRRDQLSLLADGQPLPDAPPPTVAVKRAITRLQFVYPHAEFTTKPAVESVTDRAKPKTGPSGRSGTTAENVVSFGSVLRPPRCCRPDKTLTPVDRGSLTHTVLQRLNFEADVSPAGVRKQIAGLVERRFVRADEADQADVDAVAWFAATDLGRRCRDASAAYSLRREFEIVFSAKADGSDDPADLVMVRGRIDAMLVEPEGLVLIDYKTDAVTPDALPARVEFYRTQLALYREQLERVTKRKVVAAYLVFTTPRVIEAI